MGLLLLPLLSITASAPLTPAETAVSFEGGNAGYNGLAADNFHFGIIPEPSSIALIAMGGITSLIVRRRMKRSV